MTVTLTYDDTLSRVRIAATGLSIRDTWSRTVAAGSWDTSDTGHAWSIPFGTASNFSANGSQGLISVATLNAEQHATVDLGVSDIQEVRLWLTLPVTPTGAGINWGVLLRYVDSNNYAWADVQVGTDSILTLRLIKRVAGTATQLTTLASGVTHSTSVPRILQASVDGDTLRSKVWSSDGTEPDWQLTTTDSSLPAGTRVGAIARLMTGNTNTTPVQFRFDNVAATPAAPVERSTDQVRWSTVRGGAAMVPDVGAISLDDYEFAADVPNYYRVSGQTASITPTLDGVWIKSIARPFLNRQVIVQDFSDVERPSRTGVFDVVGRSYPVAVNDVRGSRRWTLDVLTQTQAEAADFDLVLASGDPLFVHVPADCPVPGGYVTVGSTSERRTARRSTRRVFALPCTEVAAPGPDVVGATVNWQTVVSAYATWADLLAAHPTWADVLELIGSPTDVVVP